MDEIVLIVTGSAFKNWEKLLENIAQAYAGRDRFHICFWQMGREAENAVYDRAWELTEIFRQPVRVNGAAFTLEPARPHPKLYEKGWLSREDLPPCFLVKKEKR